MPCAVGVSDFSIKVGCMVAQVDVDMEVRSIGTSQQPFDASALPLVLRRAMIAIASRPSFPVRLG